MINSIVLMGGFTKDPEFQTTPNNKSIASFTLAVSGYQKADGTKESSYFECKAFDKLAEFITKNARKGTRAVITGSIIQRSWITANGEKKSKYEIVLRDFQVISSTNSQTEAKVEEPKQESKPTFTPEEAYQEPLVNDDSLPF